MRDQFAAAGESAGAVIREQEGAGASMGMPIFNNLKGVTAPLDIPNIDTDMIIPQYLQRSSASLGFAPSPSCATATPSRWRRRAARASRSRWPTSSSTGPVPRRQGATPSAPSSSPATTSAAARARARAVVDRGMGICIIGSSFADIFLQLHEERHAARDAAARAVLELLEDAEEMEGADRVGVGVKTLTLT